MTDKKGTTTQCDATYVVEVIYRTAEGDISRVFGKDIQAKQCSRSEN